MFSLTENTAHFRDSREEKGCRRPEKEGFRGKRVIRIDADQAPSGQCLCRDMERGMSSALKRGQVVAAGGHGNEHWMVRPY